MTFPVAFLVGLMGGSIIAWIAQGPLRDEVRPLRTRFGAVALMLGITVLMPAGLCMYLLAPAWTLMYVAHPDHSAGLTLLVVVLGLVSAPPAGLAAGTSLISQADAAKRAKARPTSADRDPRGGGDGRWWMWMGGLTGLLLICFVAGRGRLGMVATYEVFHYGDGGRALGATGLLLPAIVTSLAVLGVMVFSWIHVGRHTEAIEDVPVPTESLPSDGSPT